jgi:hypothetical protein
MVVGGRGQGFCDNSSKASVIKRDEGGSKKSPKLRDIIYLNGPRMPQQVNHNVEIETTAKVNLIFKDNFEILN